MVLVERPVARLAAIEEGHALVLALVARQPAGVVVLDLVVVPDRHVRDGGVERAQVGVALVLAVLAAVLGQRLDIAVFVRAERVLAGAVVEVLLVDVVAEAEPEVDVLGGDRAVGVEVAGLPVLAREDGDPHRLARVRRHAGREPPDRALAACGSRSGRSTRGRASASSRRSGPRRCGRARRSRSRACGRAPCGSRGRAPPRRRARGCRETSPSRVQTVAEFWVGIAQDTPAPKEPPRASGVSAPALRALAERRVDRDAAEDQCPGCEPGTLHEVAPVDGPVDHPWDRIRPRRPVAKVV